jgi:hypothetical protein
MYARHIASPAASLQHGPSPARCTPLVLAAG